ncbi:helix-turn-helix domain-containing protein [Oleidesulfovibrio alaskensis]|uniref:helix-turn-helix domain-containing protein n=1 Tax=Oleidesulfovibrio alaskensis TaxID=58180 RepID=UPI0009DE8D41|nr:helix-turn-helix transcriptional regulator [Oleidesulfovibrio alaskensis]
MSVGNRIKQIRGRMPQKEFAATLGIAQNTLGGYERDERTPNAEVIVSIAKVFNISFDWLLTGEGCKYREQNAKLVQQPSPDTGAGPCQRCAKLEKELDDLRQDQRKEREKNDALVQALLKERDRLEEASATVLRLTQDNAELRLQLARAAPEPAEANRRSA